jgi:hypothetical protein
MGSLGLFLRWACGNCPQGLERPQGNGLVEQKAQGLSACRLAHARRCRSLNSPGVWICCRGTERNSGLSSRGPSARSVWRPLKRKGRRRIACLNLEAAPCMVESSPQALPKFQSLAADRTVVSHSRSRFSRKHCSLRVDVLLRVRKTHLARRTNVSATLSAKNARTITLFSRFLGHPNFNRVNPQRAGSRSVRHRQGKMSTNHLTPWPPGQKSLTRSTKGRRTGVHRPALRSPIWKIPS